MVTPTVDRQPRATLRRHAGGRRACAANSLTLAKHPHPGSRRYGMVGVAGAVALYICGAYWFTASTSFANPVVTLARAFTPTFPGIAPGHVAGFVAAQVAGAILGFATARVIRLTQRAEIP